MSLVPSVQRTALRPLDLTGRHLSDLEFLPAALEILERPPSPVRTAFIRVIAGFVCALLVWSYVGRIDIVATAQGKLQPVGRVKVVQPLTSGTVLRVDAANGASVRAGDTVLELDPAEARAEVRAAQLALASTRAEIARRRAALAAAGGLVIAPRPAIGWDPSIGPDLRDRETGILSADLAQLGANLATLEAQQRQKLLERDELAATMATQRTLIATLQQRVDMRTNLIELQAGTRAALIDATETLQYQLTQLALQNSQMVSDENGAAVFAKEAEKARNDFLSDNAGKLGEAERRAEGYGQDLARADAKLALMTLRAPVDGVVDASTVVNPGQVLESGQEVMRIIPDGTPLETEVYVENRDIGLLQLGQEAVVKLEAFPFTRYGTLKGRVTAIGKDAIPEPDASGLEGDPTRGTRQAGLAGAQRVQNLVFPVRLSLDADTIEADGRQVRLSSGMSVSVDFRTGTRRILDYFLSPIAAVSSQALRER